MPSFLEIAALPEAEARELERRLEEAVAAKVKEGLLTEREVLEIQAMRLKPLPDIQDVASVYEDFLLRPRD